MSYFNYQTHIMGVISANVAAFQSISLNGVAQELFARVWTRRTP
jgi:hypothetical protein